jgi:hypothetical protein
MVLIVNAGTFGNDVRASLLQPISSKESNKRPAAGSIRLKNRRLSAK